MAIKPSSPPEPVIDDPPRQFPDWLRRLDPLLVGEDTNALFRAFLIRRTVHRGGRMIARWHDLWALGGQPLKGWALMLILMVAYHMVEGILESTFGFVMPWWGMIIIFLAFYGGLIFLISEAPQTFRMPMTLTLAIARHSESEQATREICMIGRSWKDVAGTLYLEQRLAQFLLLRVLLSLVVVPVALLILAACFLVEQGWRWTGLVTIAALVQAVFAILAVFHVYGRASAVKAVFEHMQVSARAVESVASDQQQEPKRTWWQAIKAFPRELAKFLGHGTLGIVVGGMMLVGIMILCIAGVMSPVLITDLLVNVLGADAYTFAAVFVFLVTLGITVFMGFYRKTHEVLWPRIHEAFPVIHEAWVATVVFNDAEGFAAPFENHGLSDHATREKWYKQHHIVIDENEGLDPEKWLRRES